MKKTLIALLAASTCAMGATTLEEGVQFTEATYTAPSSWNLGGLSVTLVLNVTEFAELFDNATSAARPVFVSMSGSGSNIVGLEAHEADRITGASGVVAGGTYNNLYTLDSNGTNDSIASINWGTAKAAALTLALETSNKGTFWSLTVLDNDGTYTNTYAGQTGLRWSNMGDITKVAIDTNVVSTAYAFDGHHQGDDAYVLNKAAIEASLPVPEPTTATLSLLALAGLAARRRRR